MTLTLSLDRDCIDTLDLTSARSLLDPLCQDGTISTYEQSVQFQIDYPRSPEDPRELSEVQEVRLWFIRLDACYPWLPLLVDPKSGDFARYVAMLVPHEFHRNDGIQYNPEALEIWLMHKIFILAAWLQEQGIPSRSRLKGMAQLLGYDLDDELFDALRIS
jgi:hypothetical protein